jgi:hypothetical protein
LPRAEDAAGALGGSLTSAIESELDEWLSGIEAQVRSELGASPPWRPESH